MKTSPSMLAKFLFHKITFFFQERNQALGKKEKKASSCFFFFFFPLENIVALTSEGNLIHSFTVLGRTQRIDHTAK